MIKSSPNPLQKGALDFFNTVEVNVIAFQGQNQLLRNLSLIIGHIIIRYFNQKKLIFRDRI
jgi:hypothetical protein